MNLEESYNEVLNISKEAKTLEGVMRLVEWDQETYMPKGAAPIRSEQLSLLAGMCHELMTSEKYISSLEKLIDVGSGVIKQPGLGQEKESALKEWRRDLVKATALPTEFVKEFAQLTSEALGVWQKARATNDFPLFAPYLKRIIELSRKKATFVGYEKSPYDALLDDYEPGVTADEVEKIFSGLGQKVKELLKSIKERPQVDFSFLHGTFDEAKQMQFSRTILEHMGYDFQFGRIDTSTHPFSTSFHPTDSRVTTRMHSDNLLDCILATVHEGGHSLYEMGLPAHYFGSPLCEAISMGMHESQSRFWETRIGQSKSFWSYFLPKLKEAFPELQSIDLDTFYKAVNRVKPTFCRVEADEVSYPLHVILRFEMERGLIEGTIEVDDVPKLWNEKMTNYLGITPTTDTEGCLQDIHWAMGGFGYFPSYTLGNLYASHLFLAFEKQHPDWKKQVSSGEFLFIKEWLNKKVHAHGRRYRTIDLLKRVHEKEFSEKDYISYLTNKYQEIYGF